MGSIKSLNAFYFHRCNSTLTYFVGLNGVSYENQLSGQFNLGAYINWNSRWYSFISGAEATRSLIYPRVGVFELHYKMGNRRQFIPLVGINYTKFSNPQRFWSYYTGFDYYIDKWILSYRWFGNIQHPGSHFSSTNLGIVAYGEEGKQWTFLSGSFGNNAYETAPSISVLNVDQHFWRIALHRRQWLTKHFGLLAEASFTDIRSTTNAWGVFFGIFNDF
jgi:YaiO family outer membrane protein